MDVMSLRRGLMMGMGKPSILTDLFEIVETFTPETDTYVYDFPYHGPGSYVLISFPVMTPAIAALSQYSNNIQAVWFIIRPTKVINGGYSLSYLKNGGSDYWAMGPSWLDDGKTTLQMNNQRCMFVHGFTYYLCKAKEQ